MNASNPASKFTPTWLRATPAPMRWQTLQSQLSRLTGTASSGWTRRSTSIRKWHALPASVSAMTPAAV